MRTWGTKDRSALAAATLAVFLAILAISSFGYRDVKVYQRRAWCALPMQSRGMSIRMDPAEQARIAQKQTETGEDRTTHWSTLTRLDSLVRRTECVIVVSGVGCLLATVLLVINILSAKKMEQATGGCRGRDTAAEP